MMTEMINSVGEEKKNPNPRRNWGGGGNVCLPLNVDSLPSCHERGLNVDCMKVLNSEYLNSGFSLAPVPPFDTWLVPSHVARRQCNEHFFAAISEIVI